MKVYSVLAYEQYQGFELIREFLGVYGSREEAVSWIKSYEGYKNKWRDFYGVVESELGQVVDAFDQIEYVNYE